VLEALALHGRLSATEILNLADDAGMRVSFGMIYVTMERYVERGYVIEEQEPGGPRRGGREKTYWRITKEGRDQAPAKAQGVPALA